MFVFLSLVIFLRSWVFCFGGDPGIEASATEVSNACAFPDDQNKLNFFIYQCLFPSQAVGNERKQITDDFKTCCRIRRACRDKLREHPVKDKEPDPDECRDMFCDCLSIVVAANNNTLRSSDCAYQNLSMCQYTKPADSRRASILLTENVGFMRKFGANLVLGVYGWSLSIVGYILGTMSIAYVIVSWIHFKCSLPIMGVDNSVFIDMDDINNANAANTPQSVAATPSSAGANISQSNTVVNEELSQATQSQSVAMN